MRSVVKLLSLLVGWLLGRNSRNRRESELRILIDTLPDLIAYIGLDHRYRLANRAYQEWFGRDPDSLIGERIADFEGSSHSYAKIAPHLDRALRGETVQFTLEFMTASGIRVGDVLFSPDRRADGSIVGAISFARDITQTRRAREEILEEVRSMELLNRAGVRLAGILDEKKLLQEIADNALAVTGAEASAVFYQPDLVDGGLPAAFAAASLDGRWRPLEEVTVTLTRQSEVLNEVDEIFVRVFPQMQPASYLSVPLISSSGGGVGRLCISHRQSSAFPERARRALECLATQAALALAAARLFEELEHAVALKDRSLAELARSNSELQQFAYIASHDLKEPLRMVTSYVRLIERRYREQLDEDGREFLHFAAEGATRMHALINGLLAYSRVGTQGAAVAEVCARGAVQDAIGNLRTAIEESGAEIVCHELPMVCADPTQLVQLFQNLIGNAIKYRGSGVPRIEVDAEPAGDRCRFTIRDNGIGIEPQFWKRVFVIFQRLHPREHYPGTGIGLSICKRIVERHGGDIWVESQPNVGSTFFFTLPAA